MPAPEKLRKMTLDFLTDSFRRSIRFQHDDERSKCDSTASLTNTAIFPFSQNLRLRCREKEDGCGRYIEMSPAAHDIGYSAADAGGGFAEVTRATEEWL